MEVTTAALAKQLLSPTPCYKGNLTLTGVYRLARGGFFFCLITAASPGIVLLMEICARASEMCSVPLLRRGHRLLSRGGTGDS